MMGTTCVPEHAEQAHRLLQDDENLGRVALVINHDHPQEDS
ncbi:hypothetical protein [Jatrophihabitans lederbergiae]|uniref:Uncharacterized protein n=1 Tax=Jatrophihabitans lederbergiae TaxID=3075547 RepID=A0ABU2JDL8_9ACTN|nr:hypothetical protein [Jatrophihabitans sp. DSM 44399]MDT0263080.1 hypothetical protein [Jatrophihabitans sp. DSM 44399]